MMWSATNRAEASVRLHIAQVNSAATNTSNRIAFQRAVAYQLRHGTSSYRTLSRFAPSP
jgi:hypothetical protein